MDQGASFAQYLIHLSGCHIQMSDCVTCFVQCVRYICPDRLARYFVNCIECGVSFTHLLQVFAQSLVRADLLQRVKRF